MRKWALLASLCALGIGSDCVADARAGVQWDLCDTRDFNRNFAGPGDYRQVIVGGGFTAPVRAYRVRLRLTTTNIHHLPTLATPDAWRFDEPDGCQSGRLTVSIQPATCPILAGKPSSMTMASERNGNFLDLTFSATFDSPVAAPDGPYTLFVLDYDHSRSASGPQEPGAACGNADQLVCFIVASGDWTDDNLQVHPMGYDSQYGVSWQDPTFWCFSMAVVPTDWTSVKRLYK